MTIASPAVAPMTATPDATKRPLVIAGLLLGIGMGGFIDGILLHQLLQLHHMLSARLEPTNLRNVQVNMVWDGLFHLLTWTTTMIGIVLLFRAARRRDVAWSGRILGGAMLAGWGLFNFVEGFIDHHILHVHHVVERLGVSAYDYAFLASGVIFMIVGAVIVRGGRVATPPPPGTAGSGDAPLSNRTVDR
jgi:uncharacterized membrane protein